MTILDTQTWVWWVNDDIQLPPRLRVYLEANKTSGFGVSDISTLEVARLVSAGRLELPAGVIEWIEGALRYPYVFSVHLIPSIVVESTRLPEPFHKDPADRLIVASAIVLNAELATTDGKILDYPHVRTVEY